MSFNTAPVLGSREEADFAGGASASIFVSLAPRRDVASAFAFAFDLGFGAGSAFALAFGAAAACFSLEALSALPLGALSALAFGVTLASFVALAGLASVQTLSQ